MQDGNPNNLALFRFVSTFGCFASGAHRRTRALPGQLCLLDPVGQAEYIASLKDSYGAECLVPVDPRPYALALGCSSKSETVAAAHLADAGHDVLNATRPVEAPKPATKRKRGK